MAAEGGFDFDREVNLPGGSFSRLLLSDDVVSPSPQTSLFSLDTPKMLCFGGSLITSQTVSVSTSTVSKSPSNASITSLHKRRNGSSEKEDSGTGKRIRPVAGINGHAKAKKKEKLGERIAALQQLVSPYGKTDTASVLHETMGYIKFLQDQVKVLCTPYLQRLPPSPTTVTTRNDDKCTEDLKSKCLCLVPVNAITDMEIATMGADFWSPVTMNTTPINGNSSMSKQ